jgi:hypothetical protein
MILNYSTAAFSPHEAHRLQHAAGTSARLRLLTYILGGAETNLNAWKRKSIAFCLHHGNCQSSHIQKTINHSSQIFLAHPIDLLRVKIKGIAAIKIYK